MLEKAKKVVLNNNKKSKIYVKNTFTYRFCYFIYLLYK